MLTKFGPQHYDFYVPATTIQLYLITIIFKNKNRGNIAI